MPSYPAGFTVSNHALIILTDALRQRRGQVGTRWRRLSAGRQALLVMAHLRKGETYADLAAGFGIGTTTVFRYIHEALELDRPPGSQGVGAEVRVGTRSLHHAQPTVDSG